jgi:hypothetical protein
VKKLTISRRDAEAQRFEINNCCGYLLAASFCPSWAAERLSMLRITVFKHFPQPVKPAAMTSHYSAELFCRCAARQAENHKSPRRSPALGFGRVNARKNRRPQKRRSALRLLRLRRAVLLATCSG